LNFFLRQKGCYKNFEANLTEPSKINQFAVLFLPCFKLNKAKGFELLYLTLRQIIVDEFLQDKGGVDFGNCGHSGGM
jgi:hypothetical protein